MSPSVKLALTLILSFACLIALVILVMPEKKRPSLPKFFQVLHDMFQFKHLFLEKLLKILYMLSTLYVIFDGFFSLFGIRYYGYYHWDGSTFLMGLLEMLIGPIIVRIAYELLMMGVIAVNNLIQINKKLGGQTADSSQPTLWSNRPPVQPAPAAPVTPVEPAAPKAEPNFVFCTYCGTRYDKTTGNCPNCGK